MSVIRILIAFNHVVCLQAVQAMHHPPLLWVVGHIHNSVGEYRVPHPAVPDGILLINAASNDLRNGDLNATPRTVELPSRHVHVMQHHKSDTQRGILGTISALWKATLDKAV